MRTVLPCAPYSLTRLRLPTGKSRKVSWHQDTVTAVAERIEANGFTVWSKKDGVPHVFPPATILEQMVALRCHLNACGVANGSLRVLPGSHCEGKLNPEVIQRWRQRVSEFMCCVGIGGVLIVGPLLLHASSPRQPLHIVASSTSNTPARLCRRAFAGLKQPQSNYRP